MQTSSAIWKSMAGMKAPKGKDARQEAARVQKRYFEYFTGVQSMVVVQGMDSLEVLLKQMSSKQSLNYIFQREACCLQLQRKQNTGQARQRIRNAKHRIELGMELAVVFQGQERLQNWSKQIQKMLRNWNLQIWSAQFIFLLAILLEKLVSFSCHFYLCSTFLTISYAAKTIRNQAKKIRFIMTMAQAPLVKLTSTRCWVNLRGESWTKSPSKDFSMDWAEP